MKKNVFSRTLAVLASTAVLGAASMMSASAATAATLSVSSAEATPGSTATLYVDVACGNDLEAFDVVVTWEDTTLEATGKAKSVDPENWTVTSEYGAGFATVVCYGTDTLADGSFAAIEFQVPETAEVGTTYAVQILSKNVTTVSSMTDGEVESITVVGQNAAAEDIAAEGTITVVAPETDAPETTAAETTAAATTTTKATTKAAAPKTGNAGVAVAVAGLVAAGATAVVLKKRH